MGLDGIAGRTLGRQISVTRRKESDRAASNDNRPVELAQGNKEAKSPAQGEGTEDRRH